MTTIALELDYPAQLNMQTIRDMGIEDNEIRTALAKAVSDALGEMVDYLDTYGKNCPSLRNLKNFI